MRIRCRIGWHDWSRWFELPTESKMKRFCFCCGLVEYKGVRF